MSVDVCGAARVASWRGHVHTPIGWKQAPRFTSGRGRGRWVETTDLPSRVESGERCPVHGPAHNNHKAKSRVSRDPREPYTRLLRAPWRAHATRNKALSVCRVECALPCGAARWRSRGSGCAGGWCGGGRLDRTTIRSSIVRCRLPRPRAPSPRGRGWRAAARRGDHVKARQAQGNNKCVK